MSMTMQLRTVCDQDIQAVESDPMKLEILYYGEEQPDWRPTARSEVHYLDGAFPSLHYLLTGETEPGAGTFPLNFLTAYRRPIGEIGWGRANFFTSADVREIAAALRELSPDLISTRFAARTFDKSDRDDLTEYLQALQAFVENAVKNNTGIYSVVV